MYSNLGISIYYGGFMNKKKEVSMRDVAQDAGVSISTVSRVISSSSKVNSETYKKVQASIEKLNFTCNSLQYRNINKNNKIVIIFLPSIFNESLGQIALGSSEELNKCGFNPLIWNSNESICTEINGLSLLNENFAQGAIFISSCIEDFSLKSINNEIPIVAIERTINDENIDVINSDSRQGMELLIDHLYKLGHRNIGFLCGDVSSSYTVTKTMAFKDSLIQRGINWDASNVISSGWTVECGYKGAEQLLSWRPQITAIICISDVLASGAINAIHNMGYKCPDDVSITGFDNTSFGSYMCPKLTTLNFQGYKMGQIAAEKIIQRINGSNFPVEKILLPMNLIQRDSTGFSQAIEKDTQK